MYYIIYTGEDLKPHPVGGALYSEAANRYRYKPSASPYRSFKDLKRAVLN